MPRGWNGDRLRDLRLRLRWRQADLAQWLGLSESTIVRLENAGRGPIDMGTVHQPLVDYLEKWAEQNTPELVREPERVRQTSGGDGWGWVLLGGAIAFLIATSNQKGK